MLLTLTAVWVSPIGLLGRSENPMPSNAIPRATGQQRTSSARAQRDRRTRGTAAHQFDDAQDVLTPAQPGAACLAKRTYAKLDYRLSHWILLFLPHASRFTRFASHTQALTSATGAFVKMADSSMPIAYAISILLCALVGGGVPLFLQNRIHTKLIDQVVVLGSIFGGGVFVASGFVHLLGDAAKELDPTAGYPLAELWCAIGILVPLCIDSLANIYTSTSARRSLQARPALDIVQPSARSPSRTVSGDTEPSTEIPERRTSSVRADADMLVRSIVLLETAPQNVVVAEDGASAGAGSASAVGAAAVGDGRRRAVAVSLVGTMVLFLALTMHSFIAGLVLGIGGSVESGLFVAIIAHKGFAAWALGCSLARTDRAQLSARAAWMWLLVFAMTTPSGVVVGMVLSSEQWVEGTVQHTLIALASGFFLYVGLMEIVAKEIVDYHTKGSGMFAVLKLLMLICGFMLMALLGMWV